MKQLFNKNQTLKDIEDFLKKEDAHIVKMLVDADGSIVVEYKLNVPSKLRVITPLESIQTFK